MALPYKILFFTISFFLILGLCRTAKAETFQIDLDNDGVTDLKAFYTSNELSHTELDRNQDGVNILVRQTTLQGFVCSESLNNQG